MAAPSIVKPYETRANMKALLGIGDADTSKDATLDRLLLAVSEDMDNYCRRTFEAASGVDRRYDAPASPILWVDDLLPDETSVTVGGVILSASEYELRPLHLTSTQPHYTHIVRLSGANGVPTNWAERGERKLVSVSGRFGFANTLPALVSEVCRIMTARLYQREISLYANERGSNAEGMGFVQAPKAILDQDCRQMLEPLVKRWHYANLPAWQR